MLHSGLKFLWWQKRCNSSRLWCKQTSSFPKFHFFCCILDYCAASEWFYICTIKLRQLTWVDGFQKWTWIEWARSNWYQNRGITFLFWCSLEHLDLRLWIFCLLWFLKKNRYLLHRNTCRKSWFPSVYYIAFNGKLKKKNFHESFIWSLA